MTSLPSLPAVSTVLFDLDGTLIDSALGTVRALQHALQHYEIDHPDDETMTGLLGSPLPVTLRGDYGLPDQYVEDAIVLFRQHARANELNHVNVYPGIPELLATLHSAGITLALSTSKTIPNAQLTLEHVGLHHYFTVVGGSEPHGPRIHKHDIIRYTLDTLVEVGHSPSPAAMVGDTTFDMQGARENNIPGIGVLWGYGTRENLLAAGATRTVSTPEELLRYLLN